MRETEPLRPGYARRVPSALPGDGFAEPRLAETAVIEPDPTPTSYAEPQLFASSIEPGTRRPSGLMLWFVAAFCLVVGIGIGFASGYRVASGGSLFDFSDLTGSPTRNPAPQEPAAPSPGATTGQASDESPIRGPVRLESEQVVPSPETAPASPPAETRKPPEPAPQAAPAVHPPAAATGPGLLQVLSRPAGAEVFLDGRLVGKTPLSLSNVEPGQHAVRLELAGFNGWATTVEVKGGGSARVAASLEQ